MKFHFISGLPRAGSTLLASLLCQNPDFTASIMTPLGRIITDALQAMGPSNEAELFLTDEKRKNILTGIFEGYYRDSNCKVAFDNNRRWTSNAALLDALFPESKIICCVRSPLAIVDSFERLFRKNPLSMSTVYKSIANTTVYERAHTILDNSGVLGFALNALKDAYYGPNRKKLYLVSYDHMATDPAMTMLNIHGALRLPSFKYNFEDIKPLTGVKEFDSRIGTPGLHSLKSKVVYEPRPTIVPPDVAARLPKPFWIKEEATVTG